MKEVPIGMVIFVMTRVLKVMIHASNAQKYMIVLKRTRSHCQGEKVKAPELSMQAVKAYFKPSMLLLVL